jgi:hypothetical protein
VSKIIQCELRSCDSPGSHYSAASITHGHKQPPVRVMVTWLPSDKGIKPGDKIVLQDMPNIWWLVESVGREHERSDIKRGWGQTDYFGKESDRKK